MASRRGKGSVFTFTLRVRCLFFSFLEHYSEWCREKSLFADPLHTCWQPGSHCEGVWPIPAGAQQGGRLARPRHRTAAAFAGAGGAGGG